MFNYTLHVMPMAVCSPYCVCLCTEGFMSDSWKFVFVRLYKDSNFCWFRSESDREVKGYVNLTVSVSTRSPL